MVGNLARSLGRPPGCSHDLGSVQVLVQASLRQSVQVTVRQSLHGCSQPFHYLAAAAVSRQTDPELRWVTAWVTGFRYCPTPALCSQIQIFLSTIIN